MRSVVVTMWFVSTADPLAVLTAEPGHDRGFGRKYLALLDPRLSLTPIGDFPLNRSAHAGDNEFYVGGFDGLAVVQTVLDGIDTITQLPSRYLRGIAATDVFVSMEDTSTGFGAFAHWRAGVCKRAFSATPYKILEDEGLPDPVEGDFWAGRTAPEDPAFINSPEFDNDRGVRLPFAPIDVAHAVIASWLGFDPRGASPDVPVSAFAVDGRKVKDVPPPPSRRTRLGVTEQRREEDLGNYDDYEVHEHLAVTQPAAMVTRSVGRAGRGVAHAIAAIGRFMAAQLGKVWALLQRRNRS